MDRVQAERALVDLKEAGGVPFSPADEEQVEALGERLGPALQGAHVLWIDPHPQNNIAMARSLVPLASRANS